MNNNVDEQQKELEKKQDDAFNDKFPNQAFFFVYLLNKAGPNTGVMMDMVEMLADRIDINE